MSASNKKKLRKEQEANKLTEKQLAAQKEARNTKLYTLAFLIAMAAILVIAIVVGVNQSMTSNGVRERNTTALTVGSHKLSNAEMNYFYIDSINSFLNTYGSYAAMFGLDTSKPLNQQTYSEEDGTTWADYFLTSAQGSAQATYAIADAAQAAGFSLNDDQKANLDANITAINLYATAYGYKSGEEYLKAMYGTGARMSSYKNYCELSALASAYQNHYASELSYTDADLRAAEADNPSAYSSFSYNTYYLAASRFLEGGTTDENGSVTYSDEEKAASVSAAEEAAASLTAAESLQDFDEAIAALPINAESSSASSTAYTDVLYSSVISTYRDWITDSARQEGDITVIPSTSTSTADDGTETTTTNGYYVIRFVGSNDNNFPLSNVRHILAAFEGGTKDSYTGATTYSEEEKAAAKAEAEAILQEYLDGDATEERFAALANEKSDDGDGTTGGLYENISPNSSYVTAFRDWAVADHAPGDTDIVETEYGYHVMFYVGDSDTLYRDYMIENDLRNQDTSEWYTETVNAAEITVGNTSYIRSDLVLHAS